MENNSNLFNITGGAHKISRTTPRATTSVSWFEICLLIGLDLCCLIGNITLMILVYRFRSLHARPHSLQVVSAAVNLLLGTVLLPVWISTLSMKALSPELRSNLSDYTTTNHSPVLPLDVADDLTSTPVLWQIPDDLCQIVGLLQVLWLMESLTLLAGISVDRGIYICEPMKYNNNVTPGRLFIFITYSWLQSLALALPPFWRFGDYKLDTGRLYVCSLDYSSQPAYTGVLISVVITTWLVIIAAFGLIVAVAMRRRRHARLVRASRPVRSLSLVSLAGSPPATLGSRRLSETYSLYSGESGADGYTTTTSVGPRGLSAQADIYNSLAQSYNSSPGVTTIQVVPGDSFTGNKNAAVASNTNSSAMIDTANIRSNRNSKYSNAMDAIDVHSISDADYDSYIISARKNVPDFVSIVHDGRVDVQSTSSRCMNLTSNMNTSYLDASVQGASHQSNSQAIVKTQTVFKETNPNIHANEPQPVSPSIQHEIRTPVQPAVLMDAQQLSVIEEVTEEGSEVWSEHKVSSLAVNSYTSVKKNTQRPDSSTTDDLQEQSVYNKMIEGESVQYGVQETRPPTSLYRSRISTADGGLLSQQAMVSTAHPQVYLTPTALARARATSIHPLHASPSLWPPRVDAVMTSMRHMRKTLTVCVMITCSVLCWLPYLALTCHVAMAGHVGEHVIVSQQTEFAAMFVVMLTAALNPAICILGNSHLVVKMVLPLASGYIARFMGGLSGQEAPNLSIWYLYLCLGVPACPRGFTFEDEPAKTEGQSSTSLEDAVNNVTVNRQIKLQ